MRKNKIFHNFIYWMMSHPWLKLIAFILAVLVWFYVREEINRFNY